MKSVGGYILQLSGTSKRPIKMSEDSKQPSHDDNGDIAGRRFNCVVCHQDLPPPDEDTERERHPELLRHLREDCPYRRKGFFQIVILHSRKSSYLSL